MKPLVAILITCIATATCAVEEVIGLVPKGELGARNRADFKQVEWFATSPWFTKPAPVCRAVQRPLDMEPFRGIAAQYGIPPAKEWTDSSAGDPKDGAVYFTAGPGKKLYCLANPKTRRFKVGVSNFRKFERDEHQMAVVKPLPSKEECVRICREWMKKLGIAESEFSRQGTWPGGFEVNARVHRETGTHPITKEKTEAQFGLALRFVQEIGGLPAFWSGFGGNVMFQIADGGEFCSAQGCLRAWEKVGDYPVLNREEIEAALKEGFCWVHDPIDCERLEVVKVVLEAFHAKEDQPQKHFPLIYTLTCKLHGGPDNGQTKDILMPALKQHRDKYPLPAAPGQDQAPKKESI